MSRWPAALVVMAVAAALLGGCGADQAPTSKATFLRYAKLKDGTRGAIVSRRDPGFAQEEPVAVQIGDLKSGDIVLLRDLGRSWDQPQWKPSAELVGRASAGR